MSVTTRLIVVNKMTSGRSERAQFGAVACPVVGGERAAAQRLRSALVDQRAEQHVLDSVRNAAE